MGCFNKIDKRMDDNVQFCSMMEIINGISVTSGIGEVDAVSALIWINILIDEINQEGFYFSYVTSNPKNTSRVQYGLNYTELPRYYIFPYIYYGVICKSLFENQDIDDGIFSLSLQNFKKAKSRIINDLANEISISKKANTTTIPNNRRNRRRF